MTPQTIEEAINAFPPAFEVMLKRNENDGGWYFIVKRAQNGGEFSVIGKTKPTWLEAFYDVWERI